MYKTVSLVIKSKQERAKCLELIHTSLLAAPQASLFYLRCLPSNNPENPLIMSLELLSYLVDCTKSVQHNVRVEVHFLNFRRARRHVQLTMQS